MAEVGNPTAVNVLFTLEWILVVPRRSNSSHGVSMNSLAFAGLMLMKGQEQFGRWIAAVGTPINSLCDMAVPINRP